MSPRASLLLIVTLAACRAGDKANDGAPGLDTGTLNLDQDGDGFPASEDCDDDDASVNAGATETCDGQDNDCDGEVDEGVTGTWYADADADGYGDPDAPEEACSQPAGAVASASDCDDADPDVHPAALEVCNDIDDDCDGEIDEDLGETWYIDQDGDGFGDPDAPVLACEAPAGAVPNALDCDDIDPAISPDGEEVCNEIDDDCDGDIDEGVTTTYWADGDGDGWGDSGASTEACATPLGYADQGGDCDDSDFSVSPAGAEACNGIDDDCDGTIDEPDATDAATWYTDADSDGHGDASAAVSACTQPSGAVATADDCDDTDAAVSPSSTELCNGIDDDCDGTTDEPDAADAATWYIDADSDGYGSSATTQVDCSQPSGYVDNADDCDDTDAAVHPGASEDWYDAVDSDCDGDDDPDACTTALPGETAVVDDPTCGVTYAASSSWSVVEEWTSADVGYSAGSAYTRIMMTPAVGQLTDDNGDGVVDETDIPDVVYNTFQTNRYRYEGYLRVLSGDGSAEHASLASVTSGGATYLFHGSGGVAIGDIDNDGWPDIVTMSTGGYVIALEGDGALKWVSSDAAPSGYAQPAIHNLDGYGTAEIIAGSLVVDGYGATVTSVSGVGGYTSFGADFDQDGDMDIVTGNAAWEITGAASLSSSASSGRTAIANLDLDAAGELLVRNGTTLYAIDDSGATLWTATTDTGSGAPCVGDLDGDGSADVGVAGRAYFDAFDASGTRLWRNSIYDSSSRAAGCSVFDFDGDGAWEVVYADQTDLYIWDGATGAELYHNGNRASGTIYEYPLVVDVDGDGNAEIVMANNDYAWAGWDGLVVLGEENDEWASALGVWNQYSYSVDNIDEDGGVPVTPDPSWLDHNTFRGQVSWSDSPDGAPDLGVTVLGACEDCAAGTLELYVAVDNRGAVFVPAGIDVALYAVSGSTETLLDVGQTSSRIDPGVRLAPMTFTVATADVGSDGLRVKVDDDGAGGGAVNECDESDNEGDWDAMTCP